MNSSTGKKRRSARRPGLWVLVLVVLGGGFAFGWFTAYNTALPYPSFSGGAREVRRGGERGSLPPGAPPGRYHLWRPGGHETAISTRSEDIEALFAMGYRVDTPYAPAVAGVTVREPAAGSGRNLMLSGNAPEALLMDMDGRVLHSWSKVLTDVWADASAEGDEPDANCWRRAWAFDDGRLLAIYDGLGAVLLDRRSELQWSYRGRVHDDISVGQDGHIYVIEETDDVIPDHSGERPNSADVITVLTEDGQRVRRISLRDAFGRSPYWPLLGRVPASGVVMRANDIQVLGGALEGKIPGFKNGNLLLSLPDMDVVAVLDPESEEIVWALAGMWDEVAEASALEGGTMLVFWNELEDDGAVAHSAVSEFDCLTHAVVWTYAGDRELRLLSESGGSCQRLDNGDTLMTEADNGRALEVTPSGAVVWEFVSPYRGGDEGEFIAELCQMTRLPAAFGAGWVEEGE